MALNIAITSKYNPFTYEDYIKKLEERKTADEMELLTGKEFIPFPTYEDILYSVKY